MTNSAFGPHFDESTPVYIKHPPASSGWLSNGTPLDAGTVMILDQDLSTLSYQNTRQVVSWFGFTGFAAATQNNSGYTGIVDITPPASPSTAPITSIIAWTRKNSMCFGPFFSVQDKQLDSGQLTMRDIEVRYTIYNAASSPATNLYFVLTDSELTPRDGYITYQTVSTSTSGIVSGSVRLTLDRPLSANATVPSRQGVNISTAQVYLWVGCALNAVNSELCAITALEIR